MHVPETQEKTQLGLKARIEKLLIDRKGAGRQAHRSRAPAPDHHVCAADTQRRIHAMGIWPKALPLQQFSTGDDFERTLKNRT